MHIAVDGHNLLHDRRGIAVYVRAVLREFAKRDDLELTIVVRDLFPNRHFGTLAEMLDSRRFTAARRIPGNAAVAWHPWNGTFFTGAAPNVATIHDCAPFAFPDPDAKRRALEQQPFRRSARTARRILTDSAFSAAEVERRLNVEPSRITVVPLAADAAFTPGNAPQTLPETNGRPYVLTVGASDDRKNRPTLVAAWRRAFPDGDVALVAVGGAPEPGIVHLTSIPVQRLRDLYRGARCVAIPSTYEGFGLPALEALACGAPVAVSRAASLPEVCGNAGLYVDDPLDVEAWATTLHTLAHDEALRKTLHECGLTQSSQFSWKRCATETLAVLRAAATF